MHEFTVTRKRGLESSKMETSNEFHFRRQRSQGFGPLNVALLPNPRAPRCNRERCIKPIPARYKEPGQKSSPWCGHQTQDSQTHCYSQKASKRCDRRCYVIHQMRVSNRNRNRGKARSDLKGGWTRVQGFTA